MIGWMEWGFHKGSRIYRTWQEKFLTHCVFWAFNFNILTQSCGIYYVIGARNILKCIYSGLKMKWKKKLLQYMDALCHILIKLKFEVSLLACSFEGTLQVCDDVFEINEWKMSLMSVEYVLKRFGLFLNNDK